MIEQRNPQILETPVSQVSLGCVRVLCVCGLGDRREEQRMALQNPFPIHTKGLSKFCTFNL